MSQRVLLWLFFKVFFTQKSISIIFFYFLKIIFEISTLKWFENIKNILLQNKIKNSNFFKNIFKKYSQTRSKSKIQSSGQERNLCDFACFFFRQKSRNIKWPREKFMWCFLLVHGCTQVVFSYALHMYIMPCDSSLAICVFPGGKALKLYINSQRIPKKNSSTGSSFHDVTKENNKDQIENWLWVGGLYEASPYPNQWSKWDIQFAKVVGPYVVLWLVG